MFFSDSQGWLNLAQPEKDNLGFSTWGTALNHISALSSSHPPSMDMLPSVRNISKGESLCFNILYLYSMYWVGGRTFNFCNIWKNLWMQSGTWTSSKWDPHLPLHLNHCQWWGIQIHCACVHIMPCLVMGGLQVNFTFTLLQWQPSFAFITWGCRDGGKQMTFRVQ